ncbi:MAG: NUDIX hydrolase [Acidimicrobiales bacterium]
MPVAMVLARATENRLLLVKRGVEPLKGFWAPPSGYVEMDETVEQAAVREALEETGMEVALDGLEGVFSAGGLGIVLVVYTGRVTGGCLAPGSDAEQARLVDPRDLPSEHAAPNGTELERWFAALLARLIGAPSLSRGATASSVKALSADAVLVEQGCGDWHRG